MKNMYIGLCCLLIMVTGCATKEGFDRGALREHLYGASVEITEEEIKNVFDLKPQLQFPFRLGVYFLERYRYVWRYGEVSWEGKDKQLSWLEPLKDEGILSEIIPITSLTLTEDADEEYRYRYGTPSLKSIRLAAARHHADAVLIVDYVPDVDRYNNFTAFLYITIIGGFFVPGTHSDALVLMNGALWDVRNEYLYLTVEVEEEHCRIGTAFLLRDEDTIREAKHKALSLFHEEVLHRMRRLKGDE